MKYIEAALLYVFMLVTLFFVTKWAGHDYTLTIALAGLYLSCLAHVRHP